MGRNVEKEIPRLLFDWYRTNRRDLPWRGTKDPYRTWVAEIMLQQTRVDTVIPYYERFLKRFPDVRALARAREDDVLKAWENLGYYSRARHLSEAARIVVERFGGSIPSTMEGLRALPGVGAYTAGAILSIAFGRPIAAVDGNVIRVIARLFGIEDSIARPGTRKKIGEIVRRLVPTEEPATLTRPSWTSAPVSARPGGRPVRPAPCRRPALRSREESRPRCRRGTRPQPFRGAKRRSPSSGTAGAGSFW